MNARRSRLWWGFAIGAGVLLAALSWASLAVYRLESRSAEAQDMARRQEVIRRALWRVDSQVAPIIAMEAARPIDQVPLFIRPDGGSLAGRASVNQVNSELQNNDFANGYFLIDPSGDVAATDRVTNTIAQQLADIGETEERDIAFDEPSPPESADSADQEPGYGQGLDYAAREQVANIARQDKRKLGTRKEAEPGPASSRTALDSSADDAETALRVMAPEIAAEMQAKAKSDLADMADMAEMPADDAFARFNGSFPAELAVMMPQDTIGRTRAAWLDNNPADGGPSQVELVFFRNVRTPAGDRSEGVRLDWPALRGSLLESVEDLLPNADLIPVRGQAQSDLERSGGAYRLATIPALLVPGSMPGGSASGWMTPALWALLVTWCAMLTALVAVGAVLRATLRLSDRRARFVGAVTHELRTPLTTFRLYAQMLAGGMVTEEESRREYLSTLERESVRLGEIVENVLEYARLTRRRPGDARPPGERSISPSELVARVRPALSRRAEQSGMDLIVSVEPSAESDRTVTCDPRSVERILMNLVENACKYAGPDDDAGEDDADTRIHLDLSLSERFLDILVADHGPGVPRRERERVFGEFHRGPGAAEGSRPGLGLGLALSRGLARESGGDLRLVRRRGHGAEFLLTVPLDAPGAEQAD